MTDDSTSFRKLEKLQKVNFYCVKVIFFISLSSAAYGYAASIIATTLSQPSFYKQLHLDANPDTPALIGAMNGLYFVGGVVGSILGGWTSKNYGRKMSVVAGLLLILLSGALLTASVNSAMFIVFRFFSGWGCFQVLSSVPLWVAELAPPQIRGVLIDVHAFLMLVGYNIAAYVGLGFYFVPGTNQWRGPIGLQMVLPAIVLSGIYWMPESPRYLLSKGRTEEAWKIVHAVHSNSGDLEDEFAKREFFQMRKQIEFDMTLPASFLHILKTRSLRKRALMTCLLQICIQSSGVLVILNYGSIIWGGLGFDTVQILNFQGGFQLVASTFGIVAMTFVDKVKRPRLIGFGLLAVAADVLILTLLQSQYLNTNNRGGLAACGFTIYLFSALFSMLIEGAVFFYVAEIWPTHLRPQGFAIAMTSICLIDLIWLQCAPIGFESIQWGYFIPFICIPGVGGVIVLFWFPDTLHKPLEEIAAMFGDKDMVMIYQQDLDNTQDALEKIDQEIPSQDHKNSQAIEEIERVA